MSSLIILALGNSLTAGFGVRAEQAYPALLEQKLVAAGYACRVINAGINGETSSGALSRVSRTLTLEPDIAILEIGLNDHLLSFDPALTASNIRRIVQIFKENGVTVILAGMPPIRTFGGEDITAFARLYPAIAKEEALEAYLSDISKVALLKPSTQTDRPGMPDISRRPTRWMQCPSDRRQVATVPDDSPLAFARLSAWTRCNRTSSGSGLRSAWAC